MIKINKMVRFLLLVIVIPMLSYGCNGVRKAQKQLEQIERDYPMLFKADTTYLIKNDTILLPIKESRLDTLIMASDTIFVENDRVSIQMIRVIDSIRIDAECKPDTIQYYRTDTIQSIQKNKLPKNVYVKYVPFWYRFVNFMFFLFILIFIYLWGTIYSDNRLY